MRTLVILAIIFTVALSHTLNIEEQLLQDLWDQWKQSNQRVYSAAEDSKRFKIFTNNYLMIVEHNAVDKDVTLGLNQFADLTLEEWGANYLGLVVPGETIDAETKVFNTDNLPESVDWRKRGAVNSLKHQGKCGACWAFSAVAALESLHFIKTGKLEAFSEQNLVDCTRGKCNGCGGGFMADAFKYTAQEGVQYEKDYPYKAKNQKCHTEKDKVVRVNTGFMNVTTGNTEQMKAAVAMQPVSVGVDAMSTQWMFYKKGVIKKFCGPFLTHAVTVVGYTKMDGVEAFIVRNNYGPKWGDNGYIHVSTNQKANSGLGVCGILTIPSYPIKNG